MKEILTAIFGDQFIRAMLFFTGLAVLLITILGQIYP